MNETLNFQSAGAVSPRTQERRRQAAEEHRTELRQLVANGALTQAEAEERGL